MAKKQTFAEKVRKGAAGVTERTVKLIISYQSPKSGTWRFGEKILRIPADANEKTFLDEQIQQNLKILKSR